MSPKGVGIRRGAAAARQFTQIANALFRDAQVSLRAKGIFGSVSTHRSGWQVTIDDLVRVGPDGRDAVRAGLVELEAHGYLIRERLRRGRHPRQDRLLHHRPPGHRRPRTDRSRSGARAEAEVG